jgi:hypothetical protein
MKRKENMKKGLSRNINYFAYFLFLIATKPKEVFTSQKNERSKK